MKEKGFTLAEMVAVIAILMVLALISAPFIRGYIDDSYNMKAQAFMRQINEARMNFEKDYPGVTVTGTFPSEYEKQDCDIDAIYGDDGTSQVSPEWLLNCNYLKFSSDLSGRYQFKLGSSADACDAVTGDIVISMKGLSGNYEGKCAGINTNGELGKQKA